MAPVSVTIITFNEAAHIEACLTSVAWADDVLVVDSGSTDDTVDRARRSGARVLERPWPGYAAQKNAAAEAAEHDWVLSVDADERVTGDLGSEVRRAVTNPGDVCGFRIPRVTWHLGRWIRTTDWYPDYQLRLYDRRRARWAPRRVHESVQPDGTVGQLTNELQHYPYRDISHHHATMDRYTTLAAEEMWEAGRRTSALDVLLHPPAAFLRNYVLKRGALDGVPGLIISAMNAHYVLLKFAKLWTLEHGRREGPAT